MKLKLTLETSEPISIFRDPSLGQTYSTPNLRIVKKLSEALIGQFPNDYLFNCLDSICKTGKAVSNCELCFFKRIVNEEVSYPCHKIKIIKDLMTREITTDKRLAGIELLSLLSKYGLNDIPPENFDSGRNHKLYS